MSSLPRQHSLDLRKKVYGGYGRESENEKRFEVIQSELEQSIVMGKNVSDENSQLAQQVDHMKELLEEKQRELQRLQYHADALEDQLRDIKSDGHINTVELETLRNQIKKLQEYKRNHERMNQRNVELRKLVIDKDQRLDQSLKANKELKKQTEQLVEQKDRVHKKLTVLQKEKRQRKDDGIGDEVKRLRTEVDRIRQLRERERVQHRMSLKSLKSENFELKQDHTFKKVDRKIDGVLGSEADGKEDSGQLISSSGQRPPMWDEYARPRLIRIRKRLKQMKRGTVGIRKDLEKRVAKMGMFVQKSRDELDRLVAEMNVNIDHPLKDRPKPVARAFSTKNVVSAVSSEKNEDIGFDEDPRERKLSGGSKGIGIKIMSGPLDIFTIQEDMLRSFDFMSLFNIILCYFPLMLVFSFAPPLAMFILHWAAFYHKIDGFSLEKNWNRIFKDEKVRIVAILGFFGYLPGVLYFWVYLHFLTCLSFVYCSTGKRRYYSQLDMHEPLIQ